MSVQVRRRAPAGSKASAPQPTNLAPRPQEPRAAPRDSGQTVSGPALERREIHEPAHEAARPAPQPSPRVSETPIAGRSAMPESPSNAQAPEPRRREDIVTYWSRLRGGRRYPSTANLDNNRIALDWPNSILIRRRAGSRSLEPEKVYSNKDGVEGGLANLRGAQRLHLSPMMLQWLLSLAAEVVREGRPMTDDEMFPSLTGSILFHAVALPFSEDQSFVDHVLCHLTPDSRGGAR